MVPSEVVTLVENVPPVVVDGVESSPRRYVIVLEGLAAFD